MGLGVDLLVLVYALFANTRTTVGGYLEKM